MFRFYKKQYLDGKIEAQAPVAVRRNSDIINQTNRDKNIKIDYQMVIILKNCKSLCIIMGDNHQQVDFYEINSTPVSRKWNSMMMGIKIR